MLGPFGDLLLRCFGLVLFPMGLVCVCGFAGFSGLRL